MTALDIVQGIFGPVWALFTDVPVPGLGVSFGALLLAIILIKLSVAIARHVFGFGGGTGYRSGSAKNPKISDDRKGDEY